MKAVKFLIILVIPVLVISSCDRRGNIATGIPEFEITVEANPTDIALTDSSEISVVVSTWVSEDPEDSVLVKFYAIDYGTIVAEEYSSAYHDNGLQNPVYFYPDHVGINRIVAQCIGSTMEYTDSDTVSIQVIQ